MPLQNKTHAPNQTPHQLILTIHRMMLYPPLRGENVNSQFTSGIRKKNSEEFQGLPPKIPNF